MVNDVHRRRLRRPRVYTLGLALLLVALALGGAPAAAPAPVDLTVEPGMVKGPAGAPVTIVEFSDYQ